MEHNKRLLSATKLLKEFQVPLDAKSFNAGMVLAGLLEERTYLSSTGSGEVKRFRALTEAGLAFGENVEGVSLIRTEVQYYRDTFPAALRLCFDALLRQVDELVAKHTP